MDDLQSLLSEIAAGEDTYLELKEVVFKGDQVRFAREEGKAQTVLAEVFVSMANTEGGTIVFGINNNREIVGIDESRRDILEQFVVNLCLNNCNPGIEPILDWLYLPNSDGRAVLCLKVSIPKAKFYVHSTSDGRYLKRVGSHRTLIPAEQLGRLLSARRLAMPAEERPVFRVGTEVIDRLRFDAYYQRRFGRLPDQADVDVQQLYLNLKLAVRDEAGDLRATILGVLLFSERPDTYINGAFIDVAAYMESRGEGFLTLVRESERVSGRRPEIRVVGQAVCLTIHAAPMGLI